MAWNTAEDSQMEQVNTKRPVRYCGAVALAATARYGLNLSSVHSVRLQDTISILVPC